MIRRKLLTSDPLSNGLNRRDFMKLSLPFLALGLPSFSYAAMPVAEGQGTPFSFDLLVDRARELAAQPFREPAKPAEDVIKNIHFEDIQKVKFKPRYALWGDAAGSYPVRMFHLHKYAPSPVKIHVVSDGMSRQIEYNLRMFDYGDTKLDEQLPEDLGFAGFRVMGGVDEETDWLAFQGASYFRSSGESDQYGLSARALALNTATESKEEFPAFTEFWIEESDTHPKVLTIYALLESKSATGAYRFDVTRDKTVTMDVQSKFIVRNDVQTLGIAPLTSMYWFGENHRRSAVDWRPEVHDNDGLSLWTGAGERIFRPLTNPPRLQVSTYIDENPRGFGLVQRDRDFDHYQDDGAFYERRPSVWIEPTGEWGKGAIQLVEIPTDDEIHDNIVAFWKPENRMKSGEMATFNYRLHWRDLQPYPPDNVAQVIATRTGRAGVPGQDRPSARGNRKFVIDFQGGPISEMEPRFDIEPVITPSRGEVTDSYVINVVGTSIWRAVFDVAYKGDQPLDLRCYLRLKDKTLSETWLYTHFPHSE